MHTYIYSVRREARAHVATRAARSSCMWHLRVCALVESLPWGAASLTDLKVTEAPEARDSPASTSTGATAARAARRAASTLSSALVQSLKDQSRIDLF